MKWAKPRLTAIERIIRQNGKKHGFLSDLPQAALVLDLGCGPGVNGLMMKAIDPLFDVSGVDICSSSEVPDFYSFQEVDLDKGVLPFPDQHFDALVFTHVIEHLHSPLALGPELNRIMKVGARIYVETPNWTSTLVPSFRFQREQGDPLFSRSNR